MNPQPGRKKVITEFRVMVFLGVAFTIGFFVSMSAFKDSHISTDASIPVEAIVIPGGGSQRGDTPETLPDYVKARLDAALDFYSHLRNHGHATPVVFITLSFGTVHKPNYANKDGWVVSESTAGALYLLLEAKRRGIHVDPKDILRENLSLDTVGNAFFTRALHCDVAGYRRLHVITSRFHLARTRAIFEFIFGCVPTFKPYILSFQGTPNMVDGEVLAARTEREKKSLEDFHAMLSTKFGLVLSDRTEDDPSVTFAPRNNIKMRDVHHFVFTEHTAYATREDMVPASPVADEKAVGGGGAGGDKQGQQQQRGGGGASSSSGGNETAATDAPVATEKAKALLDTY